MIGNTKHQFFHLMTVVSIANRINAQIGRNDLSVNLTMIVVNSPIDSPSYFVLPGTQCPLLYKPF